MQAPVQKSFTAQGATAGFTLIEVMITVAIVGILAAIALPNFTEYLVRSRLTEATATLSGHRVKMEQFYQDNRTYTGACDNGSIARTPAETEYFLYGCKIPDDNTYILSASGKGSLAPAVFSLDQSNVHKTVAAPPDWTVPSKDCWVQRKGGSC